MRLILLLLFCPFLLHAQSDTAKSVAVRSNSKPEKVFADSILRSLECTKKYNDGIHVLYKDGRVIYKGRFTDWKLNCGIEYIYDPTGKLTAVKVYEEGKLTREVPVPNRE